MKYKRLLAMGLSLMLSVNTGGVMVMAEDGNEQAMVETQSSEEGVGEAPAQETPTTEAPATEVPATETPATDAPATEEPVTEAPATEVPVTEEPATEAQVTEEPTTETPATEIPATDEPVTETPATEDLGTETPTEEVPGQQEETPSSESETSGDEVVDGDETETPPETEEEEWAETELVSEEETEEETEDLIEDVTEESKKEDSHLTNSQLIARQNIVTPPDISLEFRFIQVEKQYGIIQNSGGAAVYEKKKTDSDVVGRMPYYGLCYILKEEEDWYYIESGDVRGFVPAADVAVGDVAERIVRVKGEESLPLASSRKLSSKNEAFTYTHTTVKTVLVSKVFAVARQKADIYEEKNISSRVTGQLSEGGLCYILADGEKDWIFVESGDARGFVRKEDVFLEEKAENLVSALGEDSMKLAEVLVKPEDNAACYYTMTSVKKASESAFLRSDMVNFAFQFLGNPYVWGGTSLTNGCDCSGFVQSIYAHFGYGLPRIAEAQALYGMQIPIDCAAPGDLIFYARNGYVYHVSMYIGEGQVIHAAGQKVGIIIGGIGSNAVWATRVIEG